MAQINHHLWQLPDPYLFAEVTRRVAAHKAAHPEQRLVSLGIGDVTHPLAPAVIQALHRAADDLATAESFQGYGPAEGYLFLREAICAHDYAPRGIVIAPDEVFVSTGAKEDLAQFQNLFASGCRVAVADPVYPVYVETNAMAGRAGAWDGARWEQVIYLPCTAENGFVPDLPEAQPDLIYLCNPNNPTGTTLNRAALERFVQYARRTGAIILYDSAYETFIVDPDVPHSIYEIPGAREVAVEFRSFSKTAGFTGLRCAYVVVPAEVCGRAPDGARVPLRELWLRHQSTRFNGCSYLSQRGAEAVYTPAGQAQTRAAINAYRTNAAGIRDTAAELGYTVYGGLNAPYVWLKTPQGEGSWAFFDRMLTRAGIVCTPGAGFGRCGEGYVRLTAFGTAEDTALALERLKAL